jgi:hypothetical protein
LVVDCSTPERLYDYFVKYGDWYESVLSDL